MMNFLFRTANRQIKYRTAQLDDHNNLATLIHYETYVHRHLDWRSPLDWIGCQPFLVAEQRSNIVAALACSPDPPDVAWIRLLTVSHTLPLEEVWQALWSKAEFELRQTQTVQWAAVITLYPWFESLLKQSGFAIVNHVVMLNWESDSPLPEISECEASLRPMNFDDLPQVEEVDRSAFDPLWVNSQESLELALRQAAYASVAELDGRVVSYQISTATPMGGHLARLAVRPEMQGMGIGAALLNDLLNQFRRRGAQRVTVNTQLSNAVSLHLYQKFGFYLTGEAYPVYWYPIASQ